MPPAQMRLLVAPTSQLTPQAAERLAFTGLDQVTVPCRGQLRDDTLVVERVTGESGKLHVPFPVPGQGEYMLTTGTLMFRERPYLLEVELARGKVNHVRNQLADWLQMGLLPSPAVEEAKHRAIQAFSEAVTISHSDPAQAVERSREAIAAAVQASDLLAECYTDQALLLRHRQSPQLPTWLGVRLPWKAMPPAAYVPLQGAFNTFMVPLLWRQIETTEGQYQWTIADQHLDWCQQHAMPVLGGPLIRLDTEGMPDWVSRWSGDFESFASFAADYVANAVRRFRGRVSQWIVAARINSGVLYQLADDQKLQLATRLVETARRFDPDTPTILRFDQPYGEYLRRSGSEYDMSPLHFADALVRVGTPIQGIGLELNLGYHPDGTCARDRLDYSRLLDLWSCLGLPLHITLTAPSGHGPDPRASKPGEPLPHATPGTPATQEQTVRTMLPLLLSKAYVHSVTWNQLSDADPHEFPHSGVLDDQGAPKPALAAFTQLRKKHLH